MEGKDAEIRSFICYCCHYFHLDGEVGQAADRDTMLGKGGELEEE